MRSSDEIKSEIIDTFGFFPPFFGPALQTPGILESLWQQTLSAYVENPIPSLFKEKLAAAVSKYCSVAYCLLCHSSSLKPLGMSSDDILDFLAMPAPVLSELEQELNKDKVHRIRGWPAAGSSLEESILKCSISIFLNREAEFCQKNLRIILEPEYYSYLILFISYNRTALNWTEGFPELSHKDDQRVVENLGQIIHETPGLEGFFNNYIEITKEEERNRSQLLAYEDRRLLERERADALDVLESMTDAFIMLDRHWVIRKVNDNHVRVSGIPREEQIGQDFLSLYFSPAEMKLSQYWLQFHKTMEERIPTQFEDFYEPLSLWTEVRAFPKKDGGLAVFFNDITLRKKAELEEVLARKELEKAQAELMLEKDRAEAANSSKSSFLANMSHEIRSPLGTIMGFSDLLKSSDFMKEDIENYISVIDRNSSQLLRIIDDILDLSKVEAGKMSIENIDFSLSELLADFCSLAAFKAREKGIAFDLKLDSALPIVIKSDPTRLRQILTNVVGNAIKFTNHGRVTLTVACQESKLIFKVEDSGIGLTQEQSDELFQAFHQADVSTSRKYGGTGLGLVLTRNLCEALGGDFYLEQSKAGLGSIFVASVAVEKIGDGSLMKIRNLGLLVAKPHTVSAIQSNPLDGMRILVVEDSPDNQMLFKRILIRSGALADVAIDGAEGVDMALSNNYDIVLMDIQMPRMDGNQAVKALREAGYLVPIIALTAHAMKEERERAMLAGYTDFLSKPFQRETLIEILLKHCRKDS